MVFTKYYYCMSKAFRAATLAFPLASAPIHASELTATVNAIKPSVVAIGTFQQTRRPPLAFFGTGFAIADGLTIVTNAHVLPMRTQDTKEALVVLVGQGSNYEQREAQILVNDKGRDLVLLKINGSPLPTLKIGESMQAREGQALAFTGYPLAMALGLYPATHRATLSAIVPIAQPSPTSRQLSQAAINRMREGAFSIFQLDGTAYPGNSGSPLYDVTTGEVLGIVNMVFVKGTKENALSSPSGISYAIPSQYIKALLERTQQH